MLSLASGTVGRALARASARKRFGVRPESPCVQGKACPVTLKRPGRGTTAAGTAKPPPEIMLCFIEAREINPPEGVTPARWRPLTTHAATTVAGARRVTHTNGPHC